MDKNAGAPGVTFQLGEEYKKLGHRVEIFSYDRLPKGLPDKLKQILFPQFLYRHVQYLMKSQGIDVIDASSGDAWFLGAMRNRGRSPVLITRSHGVEHLVHEMRVQQAKRGEMKLSWIYPIYYGGFHLWEVRRSFSLADGSLFLNRFEHDYARKHFQVKTGQIIGNGLPEYLLDLEVQDTPRLPDEPVKIAFVGTYSMRKGAKYAAEALNPILKKHPHVEVTFLGTICPEAEVKADYEAELHNRLTVLPRFDHQDLPRLLKDHQIMLFPSLREGFGMALVEAMACGLAPVTSLIPGPEDIVRHGYDALTVPPQDSGAIRDSLDRLITDRGLLHTLRRNAYLTAQSYSWSSIAERTLQFYEHCSAEKTGRLIKIG